VTKNKPKTKKKKEAEEAKASENRTFSDLRRKGGGEIEPEVEKTNWRNLKVQKIFSQIQYKCTYARGVRLLRKLKTCLGSWGVRDPMGKKGPRTLGSNSRAHVETTR